VDWVPVAVGDAPAEPYAVEVFSGTTDDVVGAVHAAARRALEVLQTGDEKVGLVTRNAVSVDGESDVDVRSAAVWGLVRTAQTENPGRFVLLDVDTDDLGDLVARAVATGEPQR